MQAPPRPGFHGSIVRNIEGETAAVASVTTVDKLANDMAEAILSGEFAPGYRPDEQLLAQRYNVSRTPVRPRRTRKG